MDKVYEEHGFPCPSFLESDSSFSLPLYWERLRRKRHRTRKGNIFIGVRGEMQSLMWFWSCVFATCCSTVMWGAWYLQGEPPPITSNKIISEDDEMRWKGSLLRFLWGFCGHTALQHPYLPMKHTVLAFWTADLFSQVRKKRGGLGRDSLPRERPENVRLPFPPAPGLPAGAPEAGRPATLGRQLPVWLSLHQRASKSTQTASCWLLLLTSLENYKHVLFYTFFQSIKIVLVLTDPFWDKNAYSTSAPFMASS